MKDKDYALKHKLCYQITYSIVRNLNLINFDLLKEYDLVAFRYLMTYILKIKELWGK